MFLGYGKKPISHGILGLFSSFFHRNITNFMENFIIKFHYDIVYRCKVISEKPLDLLQKLFFAFFDKLQRPIRFDLRLLPRASAENSIRLLQNVNKLQWKEQFSCESIASHIEIYQNDWTWKRRKRTWKRRR